MDAFPRRLLAWIALSAIATIAFGAPAATSTATTESSSLQVWTEGPLPTFALDDLRGDSRDLQSLRGKTVLVHFFATWCEPCVREITSLQKLTAVTRGKPLAIVAIDVAEVDLRVRAFFEKIPVDFPVLLDRDRAVTKGWKVSALPSTFVLDANLAPKLFVEGDLDWTQPGILTALDALYPTTANNSSSRLSQTPGVTGQPNNDPPKEITK